MSPEETETTITYDKGQQLVRIFTAWPKDQRKLERAGIKPTKGDPETGLSYEMPLNKLKWKTVGILGHKKRVMSPNHPWMRQKTDKVTPS